jgi:hypothetical protein
VLTPVAVHNLQLLEAHMRSASLAAAFVAMILTGCSPAPTPSDAPRLAAAYESFKAGNQIAVGQARDLFQARLPAEPSVMMACGPEGFAARRAILIKGRLDFLDSSTAISLGETARFVHLEGLLFDHEMQKRTSWRREDHPDFECRGAPEKDVRRLDESETKAMAQDAKRFMSVWRKELHASLGADYRTSMQRAAELLNRNHLRSQSYWRENGNYD